jgi:HK97 family phage major capsid protein
MVFARMVRAAAGHRNLNAAIQNATVRRWPDVARALSASVATAGGFAVPQGYMAGVIAALYPLVSVRRLGPIVVPMGSGNLYWPRLNVGSAAGYIGENATVGATQPQFAAVSLAAKKTAGLIAISNSLLRSSSPAADVIIREDMLASLSSAEDFCLLRGDGTENTPRGIRNWVLPGNVFQAHALAGTDADIETIDGDLTSLEMALANANVKPIKPGWILSPRTATFLKAKRCSASGVRAFPEMKDGLLKGYPFAQSTNMPVNLGAGSGTEILLADFGYVVLGEFETVIDSASNGSYVNSGGATVSAFSQDQTVVRVILQSDIGMRRDEAVACLTGVSY